MTFASLRVPSAVAVPRYSNDDVVDLVAVAAVAVRRGLNRPAQGFDDDVVAVAVAGAVGAAGGG